MTKRSSKIVSELLLCLFFIGTISALSTLPEHIQVKSNIAFDASDRILASIARAKDERFQENMAWVIGITGGMVSQDLQDKLAQVLSFHDDDEQLVENELQRDSEAALDSYNSTAPAGVLKCQHNWEWNLGPGGCVNRLHLIPMGAVRQGWTNGTKAAISIVIMIVFAFRAIAIINVYKIHCLDGDGANATAPLNDLRFWVCIIGFVSYASCFASVMVLITAVNPGGSPTPTGLIVYLVLYSIFVTGSLISSLIAAAASFDEVSIKTRRVSLAYKQQYSIFTFVWIGLNVVYCIAYMIYLIVVTVIYKSAVRKWKIIEYNILAAGFIFQILTFLLQSGNLSLLWKKYQKKKDGFILLLLNKTIFWIASVCVLSILAFADIYWYTYGKNYVDPAVPVSLSSLINGVVGLTIQEQDLRQNLNIILYLLMVSVLLFKGWSDLFVPLHVYYMFDIEALRNVQTSIKNSVNTSVLNSNGDSSHSNDGSGKSGKTASAALNSSTVEYAHQSPRNGDQTESVVMVNVVTSKSQPRHNYSRSPKQTSSRLSRGASTSPSHHHSSHLSIVAVDDDDGNCPDNDGGGDCGGGGGDCGGD